ncbi:excisionase [Mycolicibacterium agri]|uniref:Excisionase n=1 Tax=Mycolicibacterium agri TaxID=36811 RepID=A0A2A7MUE9_MYCAG|nr:helix-turn-helix domain-containing protein [Mycolicibacterium agri]PEG35180.1 excisionase [Mycolicibacterium agri]GFG49462.1 hypothetical protein MAGR_09030 [Mycolicibacterium agri]
MHDLPKLPPWISIRKAAVYLDVSDKTVRRMVRRGDLKARRIGGRLIRIERESLLAHGRPLGAGYR